MMNKNNIKILLLIVVLGLPASVILFLHGFGKNTFELPIMKPQSADCQENTIDSVHRIPHFSFTSQDGKQVTQQDFDNKIYVADFFFTRCPDICKDMTKELVRVQSHFKDNADFKILSHSVDPDNDSVAVLKNYATLYNAQTPQWTFVTGTKKILYEQALCGYFIAAKDATKGELDFIHSDKLVLIDKEKRIRGYYSGTDRKDVDRLITEIQILMKTYE